MLLEQWVLCNWGSTLEQSSAVYNQSLVSADEILPGFCWLTSALLLSNVSALAAVAGNYCIFNNENATALWETLLRSGNGYKTTFVISCSPTNQNLSVM